MRQIQYRNVGSIQARCSLWVAVLLGCAIIYMSTANIGWDC